VGQEPLEGMMYVPSFTKICHLFRSYKHRQHLERRTDMAIIKCTFCYTKRAVYIRKTSDIYWNSNLCTNGNFFI